MHIANNYDLFHGNGPEAVSAFSRQWVLLRDSDQFNLDWITRQVTPGAVLYTHPDLDVVSVEDNLRVGGKLVVMGVALFAEQPDSSFVDVLRHKLKGADGNIASVVIDMCGTYVVIHCFGNAIEIYTDPAALRGVYYKDGRAASTPLLLPDIERDRKLDAVFPFGSYDEWYPGDLCPYIDTKALLANHRLNLRAAEIERFWPSNAFATGQVQVKEAVETAAALMQGALASALERWTIICSITGGKDSRVSLAASRDVVDQIQFFTLQSRRTHVCDMRCPSLLVSEFELNHRFVEVPEPDGRLLELYDCQTGGMSIGERRAIVGACAQLAGPNIVHLNGNLGAITKSFYWHNKHPKSARKSSIIREFVHKPPQVREAIDRWFQSLPDVDACTAYNLMYLEQRGGRWMGIGETGSQLFYDSLSLFNNRKVFELLCGLPAESLRNGLLLKELVGEMWPELLTIPYCRSTRGWSRLIPASKRALLKTAARSLTSIRQPKTGTSVRWG